MKVRLRADQANQPHLFAEGLALGKVYEIDDKHGWTAHGDARCYFIGGRAYAALRFDIVSGAVKEKPWP